MLQIDGRKAFGMMLADKMMLPSYANIMRAVDKVNVEHDRDFQRMFNAFYKVRLPDTTYYDGFYHVFEQCKTIRTDLTFGAVLDALDAVTGRVESSFASKILATLKSSQPIWDSQVLKYLGIKLTGQTNMEKLRSAKEIYSRIEKLYAEYMRTDNAKSNIALFNEFLPDYAWISNVKKIDYMMWGLGK